MGSYHKLVDNLHCIICTRDIASTPSPLQEPPQQSKAMDERKFEVFAAFFFPLFVAGSNETTVKMTVIINTTNTSFRLLKL